MTGFFGRAIVVTGASGGIGGTFSGAGFVAVALEPAFAGLDRLGDERTLSWLDLPGIPPFLVAPLLPGGSSVRFRA